MNKLINKIALAATSCIMMVSLTAVSAETNDPASPSTPTTYPVVNNLNSNNHVISASGARINGNYAYCIEYANIWPSNDVPYYATSDLNGLSEELQQKLKRVLYAGYPNDGLGLSKQTNGDSIQLGIATQIIIWNILGDQDVYVNLDENYYSYAQLLYKYAVDGTIEGTTLNDSVISVNTVVDKLIANSDGTQSGTVHFESSKGTSITVEEIPEGIAISNNGKNVATGSIVLSTDTLTITTSKLFSNGQIRFSYVNNEIANEKLVVYKTDAASNDGNKKPYQKMLSYSFEPSTTEVSAVIKVTPITIEKTPEVSPAPAPVETPVIETPITTETPVATPASTETERLTTPTTNEKTETTAVTETDSSRNERPSTPNTGDQSNVALAAGIMTIAVLVIGVTLFFRKRFSE